MRHLLINLFATFACLSFTNSYGEENVNFTATQTLPEQSVIEKNVQKIYVQPSDIYFSDNQIFVQTPKGLIQVHSLKTDSHGIYYKTARPYSWDCPRCGEYNAYDYYCEHCNYPGPDIREGHPRPRDNWAKK